MPNADTAAFTPREGVNFTLSRHREFVEYRNGRAEYRWVWQARTDAYANFVQMGGFESKAAAREWALAQFAAVAPFIE